MNSLFDIDLFWLNDGTYVVLKYLFIFAVFIIHNITQQKIV